jgi:hypothetical protein
MNDRYWWSLELAATSAPGSLAEFLLSAKVLPKLPVRYRERAP